MAITLSGISINGRSSMGSLPEVDPYFSNVAILLHGDGTDGSTSIIDSGPLASTITRTNITYPAISTAQKVFGTGSVFFGGYGLTAPNNSAFDLTGGNFTIETRYYPTSFASTQMLANHRNPTGTNGYNLRVTTTGRVQFWYTGQTANISSTAMTLNTWNAIAIVRSGSNLYYFLNGTLTDTFSISNGTAASSTFKIGINEVSSETVTGYLDEYRITKGVARYTANYSLATTAFPNA